MANIPVLTIDGPSGSGKGTIAQLMAKDLGWHYLDSGAIYRVLAQAALKHGVDFADERAVAELAENLDVVFSIQQYTFLTQSVHIIYLTHWETWRGPDRVLFPYFNTFYSFNF